MRRTVVSVFNSLSQAKQAIARLRGERLVNNDISLVVRSNVLNSGDDQVEFAQELTYLPAEKWLGIFDGSLVQSGPIELPGVGEVLAGGPLAGSLLQDRERALADSLRLFGVAEAHAEHYEQSVRNGNILVLLETNNEYAAETANLLQRFGAHSIEEWSKSSDKPFYPQG